MTDGADNTIVLSDENDEDVSFELLDLVELDGEEYVVRLPVESEYGEEDTAEVIILKIEYTDETADLETYVSVENEATLTRVFEIFKEKFAGKFNFVD